MPPRIFRTTAALPPSSGAAANPKDDAPARHSKHLKEGKQLYFQTSPDSAWSNSSDVTLCRFSRNFIPQQKEMKTTSCVLVAAAVGTASAFMGPSPMMAGSSNKVSETRLPPPEQV